MKYQTILAMYRTILSLECIDEVTRARALQMQIAFTMKAGGLGNLFS